MPFKKPKWLFSYHVYLSTAKFSEDAYFPKGTQTSRIQFGTKTDYLPFQVEVKIQKGNKFGICGGVLISNHLVLTAYHCFKGIEIEKNHTVTTGVLTPTESGPHKQVWHFFGFPVCHFDTYL